MKTRIWLCFLFLLAIPAITFAQTTWSISGTVTDAAGSMMVENSAMQGSLRAMTLPFIGHQGRMDEGQQYRDKTKIPIPF